MNKLPTSVVMTNVASLYEPKFFEFEEELIDLVVVTTDGELLEVCNKNILSSYKICEKIKGYVTVKVIYTYRPKIKYYIVLANGMLFAVKKFDSSLMQCLHLGDDIGQFVIEDRKNFGMPQIIASNIKETVPPSELDLSKLLTKHNTASSKLIAPAVLKLYTHINALHTQIRKVQELIVEKKALIYRMTTGYMFITNDDSTSDCYEELAVVFGKKSTQKLKTRNFPFSLGNLWIKVCFDFWIIGVYLANLQNRKICNLEFLVMDPDICVEKTLFYTNDERMEPFTLMSDFKRLDYIPCHGHGYVLGVVKEPFFRNSTVRLTCNLSFNFYKNRSEQLHIGTIEVSHKDILNCAYAAFNHDKGVSDILSIFATSLQCDIKVMKFNEEVMSKLTEILPTLKFIKINEKYYLADYKKTISFRGVLLQIINKDTSCIICFYSRNFQELCLYIQSFKQLPSDFVTVKNANMTVNTLFSSLFHEIKNFNDHIKSQILENETKVYPPDAAIIPLEITKINDLILLEEDTEYNYSVLKQYRKK